jgi:hypothetical protein
LGRTGRVGSVAALVAAALIGGACTSDYVRWLPDDDRDRLDRAVPFLKKQFLEIDQAETKAAAPAEGEDAGGSDLWRKFRLLVERGRVAPTFGAEDQGRRRPGAPTGRRRRATTRRSSRSRTGRSARLSRNLRDPRIGVALSDGGVRSSFARGSEGLHETGLLSSVGYLSTVSGGGRRRLVCSTARTTASSSATAPSTCATSRSRGRSSTRLRLDGDGLPERGDRVG